VFLSGGIDSSTNAALFSEGEARPVRTFSIGYDTDYGSYQNELHFARQMADVVKAEHHERRLNLNDLLEFLPEMIRLQDEPIADPVCVPVYYVSKLARDNGVSVCQVGEGSDELFWGYPGWKTALRAQAWSVRPLAGPAMRMVLAAATLAGKGDAQPADWLRRALRGQPIFWGGAEAFTETEKLRLLSPRLRRQFAGLSSWEVLKPVRDRFEVKAWERSALHWMSYLDLNLRLPELLLMRVDKMSMGVSLEARVPFLDHKFVELALGIPTAVKTRNGELKHILKTAVRGVIPDSLIARPKQGFGIPVAEWFFDRLGDRMRAELQDFCRQTDLLDARAVESVAARGAGTQLWFLFNLALWWKQYIR
jgi:asparagine synthase (glutamine-hydrolysing)